MKIRDSVVVAVSTAIQNGVIISIDFLELSIIHTAPFQASFSGKITHELICNKVNFLKYFLSDIAEVNLYLL